jgi:alpha-1,3/alpha-1,6-mannosyltransferase
MRVYRFFLDNLEEITTAMAYTTLVNSKFTQEIYLESFPIIRRYYPNKAPRILYPAINEKNYILGADTQATSIADLLQRQSLAPNTLIITSLNRYERKKNINLALESYAAFLKNKEGAVQESILVIAGGYDERLLENVDHHLELVNLAN